MEGRDLSLRRSDGKRQAHTASVSRSFVLASIFASVGIVPAIGCHYMAEREGFEPFFRLEVKSRAYADFVEC